MAVSVSPVGEDKHALREFLDVPYRIYRDDPYYVFPLLDEMKHFHNKKKNPFYRHAEAQLWLARDGGQVVGRIGACVDRYSNEHHDEKVGFFGFYEVDYNPAAAAALLEMARDWIADQGMDTMRGPGCFTSNHDWYGLQVDGKFNRPVIGMPYNPRYYEKQFEDFGLAGAKDLFAWEIRTQGQLPEKMQRLIDRIMARPGLAIRPFDMKNFPAEASLVRDLYNQTWSENWAFIPLDDEDFAYMAKDMKSMVDPDFLLVAELEGQPIGFSLTIPDFNQALQPLHGKLLPFGWLKFLLGKRKIDYARTILMGVLPQHRKLGVDIAMVYKTMLAGFAKGITAGECSWILADNQPMNRILTGYGADMYKTYRIYEKAGGVTGANGSQDLHGGLIALTGATGFLGSHIADILLARGYQVRASVRATSSLRWLEGKPVETMQVHLTDPAGCRGFLDRTVGLIHCAGVVSAPTEEVYRKANVTSTACLLEAASSAWGDHGQAAAFVLISSLAAHGPAALDRPAVETDPCRPITAYGRSKLAAEQVLAARPRGFRTAILRPPSLYGPRDAEFLPLVRLARRGWTGRLGRRLTGLSLVHGRDAAEAAVALLETRSATGPFFVDDGRTGYDWSALAEALGRMAGRKIRTLPVPVGLLKLAAFLAGRNRANRSPVLNQDRLRDLEAKGWVCNGRHLVETTGFKAGWDAAAGFTDTLEFYLKEKWL